MNTEVKVEINGDTYLGIIEPCGNYIQILNVVSEDDMDVLGRFKLNQNRELVDIYPMSMTEVVIGKVV